MRSGRTRERGRARLSLRARLAGAGVLLGLLVLAGALHLARVQQERNQAITRAVGNLAREQELADRLSQGVMQELLAIIDPDQVEDEGASATGFDGGMGNEVHRLIRAFLELPLSLEERLLVEDLREAHQRVEISASHTILHEALGETALAAASRRATGGHVVGFLEDLDRFLTYRADGLRRLQSEQEAAARRVLWAQLLTVLLILTLVAGGTLSFHRRLSRPLLDLLEGAERIGQGDLTTRVPREHDPEFDRVAEGFNRMAAGLEKAQQELENRNTDLTHALSEVRRTQADLIQAEKMAALGRLSAGLAHELNNPLAAVVGFAELLAVRLDELNTAETDELRRDLVEPVRAESERARDLITTILGFSRRPDEAVSPVSVRETVKRIHVMRSGAFRNAGLAFEIDDLPDLWIRGNPPLLQSVVLNLVNNALDAMEGRPAGALRVHGRAAVDAEGHQVEVFFDDDGDGFDDPHRAFEPFFTTKPPGSGTGLGLSLVHRFVQQFGGSVSAVNRPEGGARLVLRFPAAEPGPTPPGPGPTTVPGQGTSSAPRSHGKPREADRHGNATVLVVDDEAALRNLQARILRRMGITCREAGSVAEAKAHLEDGGIDAVVSDIRMPGESGVDLLEWVRKENPGLAERFLLVTGDATHPDVASVAGSDPGNLLLKPFPMETYRERILAILPEAREN